MTDRAKRGQFGQVPRELMEHPSCTAAHISTWAGLSVCLDFDSRSGDPPIARIAERSHLSGRHVRRMLADLEAWGALTVGRYRGARNRYRLIWGDNPQPRTPTTGVAPNDRGHTGHQPRTSATPTEDTGGRTLQTFQNTQRDFSGNGKAKQPPIEPETDQPSTKPHTPFGAKWGSKSPWPGNGKADPSAVADLIDEITEPKGDETA